MYLIFLGCCRCMLDVVIGRAAPLRVVNNAIVILLLKDLCRISLRSSHVILLRNGCPVGLSCVYI